MFPFIYIFGKAIGMYGICMMIGLCLSCFLAIRRGKRYGICADDIIIVTATAFGFAIACGVLLYAFVTYPVKALLFMLKNGDLGMENLGIVFYGGLIGGIFGAWVGTKIAKTGIATLVPAIVPFIPLGHAIGRIGCLMAGCCHGMEYDGIFAVHYPQSVLGLSPHQGYFPVQPLESVLNLAIFAILLRLADRVKRNADLLFAYLSMYASSRFVLEFFRGDEARGSFLHISTSQWISLGLLLSSSLFFCFSRREKAEIETEIPQV